MLPAVPADISEHSSGIRAEHKKSKREYFTYKFLAGMPFAKSKILTALHPRQHHPNALENCLQAVFRLEGVFSPTGAVKKHNPVD